MSENGNHGNNDGEVIIDVKNLHKKYGHTEVIKGVDLTVRKGEVICIIGPSGAGKSTILRCLNGLEQASSGQIVVNGHDLGDPHVNIDQVREQVGMVFQHFNLFNNMSVIDNRGIGRKGRCYAEIVVRRSKAACGHRSLLGHASESHAVRRGHIGARPGNGRRCARSHS